MLEGVIPFMLRWISMLGGVLIMMGHDARSETLFYYFRLEDQIPENHLLRLLDKHVSFDFVRQQLKGSYSDTGRLSIDPELLLRVLLIGYLYGTSERKLVQRVAHSPGPGAGSRAWALIRRLRITLPSPRTATVGSKSQSCLSSWMSRSCGNVFMWGWLRASACRWTAALSRLTHAS